MYFSKRRICEAERSLITDVDCFSFFFFSWIWPEICHFWLFFNHLIEPPPPREDAAIESARDWLISASASQFRKLRDPRKHGWLCSDTRGGKKNPKKIPSLHHFYSSLQTSDILAKQGKPLVVRGIYQHGDQAERRGEHVYTPGVSHFHVLRQHCRLGVAGWFHSPDESGGGRLWGIQHQRRAGTSLHCTSSLLSVNGFSSAATCWRYTRQQTAPQTHLQPASGCPNAGWRVNRSCSLLPEQTGSLAGLELVLVH